MMQIIDCEQGSPEWFTARMGIPTASEFKTVLAVKKEAREKITRQAYMRKLAGEVLTGLPMESYSNGDMQRGKDMEDEARDLYALLTDVDPMRVGFIINHGAGCSPDSLIEEAGGLEIKSALPHIQIERLESGELPAEHRAQVQGNIWLAEREWWDFASYCPRLPLFVKRINRDDGYIATLAGAVNQFNEELAALIERMRSYGEPAPSTMDMLKASVAELGSAA
jgi:hypothetical protein